MIFLVKVHDVDDVWPRVRELIKPGMKRSDEASLTYFWNLCRTGSAFLYVRDDLSGALILQLKEEREREVAQILAVGATVHVMTPSAIRQWRSDFEEIKTWAQVNGMAGVVFDGPEAWGRVLGIKPKHFKYEVSL